MVIQYHTAKVEKIGDRIQHHYSHLLIYKFWCIDEDSSLSKPVYKFWCIDEDSSLSKPASSYMCAIIGHWALCNHQLWFIVLRIISHILWRVLQQSLPQLVFPVANELHQPTIASMNHCILIFSSSVKRYTIYLFRGCHSFCARRMASVTEIGIIYI